MDAHRAGCHIASELIHLREFVEFILELARRSHFLVDTPFEQLEEPHSEPPRAGHK